MGQILCTCGRVAELRRRKNGKKLPYIHCKHCGLQQGRDELRAEWLANEDASNSLGVLGEFPQNSTSTSNKTSINAESEQVATSSKHQKEWTPPDELAPENKQVELTSKPDDTSDTSKSKASLITKLVFGFLGLAALGFGASKLN